MKDEIQLKTKPMNMHQAGICIILSIFLWFLVRPHISAYIFPFFNSQFTLFRGFHKHFSNISRFWLFKYLFIILSSNIQMGNCFNIGLELKSVQANKIKRFSTPVVANKALCTVHSIGIWQWNRNHIIVVITAISIEISCRNWIHQ